MDELQAIDALLPIPEVKEALGVVKGVDLKIGNHAALAEAADTIAAATRTFAAVRDGSRLAVLDRIIPQAEQYKGEPGRAPERAALPEHPSFAGLLNR